MRDMVKKTEFLAERPWYKMGCFSSVWKISEIYHMLPMMCWAPICQVASQTRRAAAQKAQVEGKVP